MAADSDAFDEPLRRLASPHLAKLGDRLADIGGLHDSERIAIANAATVSLLAILNRKLTRLLVVELHAAREEGRLVGDTPASRWVDFLKGVAEPAFWSAAYGVYPTLEARLGQIIANELMSATIFARHFVEDRPLIDRFLGEYDLRLSSVAFAGGDRHGGGRTVAICVLGERNLVYKPRSLAIDGALKGFLTLLRKRGLRICVDVPDCLDKGDHGWAEFIEHSYASGDAELAEFYRGIGQWLGLLRALGGTDVHGENLIAHGPTPYLIDCETMFTPIVEPFDSGLGSAQDKAGALVAESVLSIGLLPERGQGLGWRGVDMSGVGGPSRSAALDLGAGTRRYRYRSSPASRWCRECPRNAGTTPPPRHGSPIIGRPSSRVLMR